MPNRRRHVVVDCETTGTRLQAQATEVAWYDLETDEHDCFLVPHTLDGADPFALDLSRYEDRIAGKPVDDGTRLKAMHDRLGGDGAKVTVWGANPGFDIRFLMGLFDRQGLDQEPWHHRSIDPCSGAYWLFPQVFPPGETPGLKDVVDLLGIDLPNHHEAMADVFAAVAVIRHLNAIRSHLATRPLTPTGAPA